LRLEHLELGAVRERELPRFFRNIEAQRHAIPITLLLLL
jgi:hypothetical protein